jgi:hypothetical protein
MGEATRDIDLQTSPILDGTKSAVANLFIGRRTSIAAYSLPLLECGEGWILVVHRLLSGRDCVRPEDGPAAIGLEAHQPLRNAIRTVVLWRRFLWPTATAL